MSFPHLHIASACSFQYGTATVEQLAAAASAEGASIAALSDRDGVSGAVRHIRACLEAGIRPVIGSELLVTNPANGEAEPQQITVLAHGNAAGRGWAGLVRLISALHAGNARHRRGRVHCRGRRPVLDAERLSSFLADEQGEPTATVLLGPDSDLGRAVLAGHRALAAAALARWQQRLPGGIAIEVVCHFARPGEARSIVHAAHMLELAEAEGIPAVLTNEARHLRPDDAATGDVLNAIAQLHPLGAQEPASAQAWRKPSAMMERLARSITAQTDLPSNAASRLLEQTIRLAERCALDPVAELAWRTPKLPELHAIGVRGDPDHALRDAAERGVPGRYPDARGRTRDRLRERLRQELAAIGKLGFAPYFLTVADVSRRIRELGVRHQARGSGAGSLVNYLLGISHVDPLEHDLLFERFLGANRSTLPDIDIDVEAARRDEVHGAIFRAYGEHRVALLSMQVTRRARGAARDAARALGFDEERLAELMAHMGWQEAGDLRELAARLGEEPGGSLLADLAERLDRLPRTLSAHPCGIILGDERLLDLTPVQPSGTGFAMSQFEKDDMDDLGLLKLDVLGSRMQSAITHALSEIERVDGPRAAREGGLPESAPWVSPAGRIDLDGAPRDDEATFEMIRAGHTIGMFQLESPGQRELIGRMRPDRHDDIVASISLYRPGPMRAGLMEPFIRAKHGEGEPELHPLFREFLTDSYGVVMYHEHVLRILSVTMGVSLAEADELRRELERGTRARGGGSLRQLAARFRESASEQRDERGRRLFTGQQIDRIWRVLRGFGSFGFCRAHAASFAVTSYESAWLKTRYPVEFMAGLLEHGPGMFSRRVLLSEARRIGIPLLPLDVNVSRDRYLVERTGPEVKGIRLSLRDAHGMSGDELARIIEGQPYHSLQDFWHRAAPSRPLIMRLAAVGALDGITREHGRSLPRGEVIARARKLTAVRGKRGKTQAQPALFELDAEAEREGKDGEPSSTDRPGEAGPGALDPQLAELEVLSGEVSRHALAPYRPLLQELGVRELSELTQLPDHAHVRIAGLRAATRPASGPRGARGTLLTIEDGTGCVNARFSEEAQQRGRLLHGTELLVIEGTTRHEASGSVHLRAERAWDLKAMDREWRQLRSGSTTQHANAESAETDPFLAAG